MKNSNKPQNMLMIACLAVLFFFAGTIALRLFTRQVLILGMGLDNNFTRAVFFDNVDMQRQPGHEAMVYGDTDDYSYNWSVEYPFEETDAVAGDADDAIPNTLTSRYVGLVESLKGRIDNYTQYNLTGYTAIAELASKYEDLLGWNFSSFGEYNGVYQLSDGYWTVLKEQKDRSEHIQSFVSFSEFLKTQGIEFLYVQAPYKVSKYEDADISGTVDFSNQNADQVLAGLRSYGIHTFDLREKIREEKLTHHELFFVTDHHWTGETGLWAAGRIANHLQDAFGFCIEAERFYPDNFTRVTYEKYFLGSLGRKVTLGQADPEDITLLYPKYETSLYFEIPSIGIAQTGDFSITYNMEAVSEIDYYNKDPYHAYSYGDRAVTRYSNLDTEITENRKILLIRDSFSDCMQSFLALGVKNLETVDLRYFTGSLEAYIKESKPDMVIVMYNAGELSFDVDLSTHTNLFDFR